MYYSIVVLVSADVGLAPRNLTPRVVSCRAVAPSNVLCCVRGRAKRWAGVIRSFARRADGEAGRNGGAEAQRYEQQQPWKAIGFLGGDLPVSYYAMIVRHLFSVFFLC